MTTNTNKWHVGCGNGYGSVFADEGRMKLESGGTTLTPICTVNDFGGDRDENLNLIAAAPDLLNALKRMLFEFDDTNSTARKIAIKAIEKAEGKTPC